MTLTCTRSEDSETCPFCIGPQRGGACTVCARMTKEPGHVCTHDLVERHHAQPVIEDEPIEARAPTKPLRPLVSKQLELEFAEPDAIAAVLDVLANLVREDPNEVVLTLSHVANIVRAKGRLVVIVK